MKRQRLFRPTLSLAFAGACSLLTGCVGYNTAFFGTKTNVGLDLDTKTPTAEISIARREAVIAPAFERGQTPPVEASFRVKGAWIAAGISSTFAGGDAAATLATLYWDETPTGAAKTNTDSTLTITNVPLRKYGGGKVRLQEPGMVRPFVFGTDTSLGIKAAWSGLTAQYPDSVKLGFNRKEMALAPVTGSPNPTQPTMLDVKIPSFLATTDTRTKTGTPAQTDFAYTQYFATGIAADKLALQQDVRRAMAERLDPTAAASAKKLATDRDAANADVKSAQDAIEAVPNAAKLGAAIDLFGSNGWLGATRVTSLKTQSATDLPGTKEALKENLSRQGRSGDASIREQLRKLARDVNAL